MRPVLVILYENDAWQIRNVGNGPALDVVVAQKSLTVLGSNQYAYRRKRKMEECSSIG